MAGLSKVIVLDPDPRAGRQVQLGFEREGVDAMTPDIPVDLDLLEIKTDEVGLVVVGGEEESLELVRTVRAILEDRGLDIPILFAGKVERRTDAETAGADEVVLRPTYLRDVVTIGRILCGIPTKQRVHVVGNLGELTNVFTLIRALSALGRSATLTLMRGLRRGEVRFFHGEVTSAQVGLIHGQAALHQLLLWTDARFDWHHEDVVRRQQIPLSHDELFADAERFLEGIRESSGALSPAMVLEQDVQRLHNLGKQIPTEVHGVLRMFDGHRVLADVLEDSPYRVFETLRVAQRALEAGLLRVVQSQRPKATWRAVLAIEEWLVGAERGHQAVADADADRESKPTLPSEKKRRTRRQHELSSSLPPDAIPAIQAASRSAPDHSIDWGALVPRTIGSDVGTLAGVVPAAQASGEIRLPPPTRELEREKLEALMDTGKRDRIFPSEVEVQEPSIVFDPDTEETLAKPPAPTVSRTSTGKVREEAQNKVKQLVKAQATERALAAAEARRNAAAAAKAQPAPDADANRKDAQEELERARVAARAEAEAKTKALAEAKAKAEQILAEAKAKAEAKAHDEANRARAEAEMTAARAEIAAAFAAAEAESRVAAEAKVRADAQEIARADAEAAAAVTARIEQAKQVAGAKAIADAIAAKARVEQERAEADAHAIATAQAATPPTDTADDLVRALISEGVAVAETTARVTLHDTVTVTTAADTATLHAVPTATVSEISHPLAAEPVPVEPAPAPRRTTEDTVPSGRRKRASEAAIVPADALSGDHAGRKPQRVTMAPLSREPAMLGEPAAVDAVAASAASIAAAATKAIPATEPKRTRARSSQHSITADKPTAARTRTASAAPLTSRTKSTQNIATAAQDKAIGDLRKDAVAFSDDEEAFFRGGEEEKPRPISHDTFEDLDEGYKPVGFWDRLLGRKAEQPEKPEKPTKPEKPLKKRK